MSSDPIWKLYYWPLAGRGEFIRLIFEEVGVSYMEVNDTELLIKLFKQAELQGWPAFAPPLIERTDTSFTLAQTPVICKYFGDVFGISPPAGSDHAYHAEQVNAQIHDYIAEGRRAFHGRNDQESYYTQKHETQPYIDFFVNVRLEKHLTHFERILEHNNTHDSGFVLGDKLTYVDLGLFHVLHATESQFPEAWCKIVGKYPRLTSFMDRIRKRDNIAKYFQSNSYILSLNGRDPLVCDNECVLSHVGIVNGDTIHVLHNTTAAKYTASSSKSSKPVPMEESFTQIGTLPQSWVELCSPLYPHSNQKVLSALTHYLLLMRGFRQTGNFNPKKGPELNHSLYTHSGSKLETTVQIQTLGLDTEDETVSITVFVPCVTGRFQRYDNMLRVKEWFQSSCSKAETSDFFFNWDEIVEELTSKIINPLVTACLGEQTPFLKAIGICDIGDKVFGKLHVKDINRFAMASRACYGLVQSNALWKLLLRRDFGACAIREADQKKQSYHQAYFIKYVLKHRKSQEYPLFSFTPWANLTLPSVGPPGIGPPTRPSPPPVHPHNPYHPSVPDPLDPFGPGNNPLYMPPRFGEPPGMIGGRQDLDPFARGPSGIIDPFPNLQDPRNPNRGGPRYDWTPNQGLNPRRNPRGPPGGPFGGGGFL